MAYDINALEDGCYPETSVLINKLGLKNQAALNDAESVAVTMHAAEIEIEPCTEPFTFPFYCNLHRRLFEDLYDWAGSLRTVNLSKKGTNFCPTEELSKLGNAKFAYLQSKNEFKDLNRDQLILEITSFYHELNMLHPFREGNGRTQRLFFSLLLHRLGYDISFANCDTDELMIATIYSAQGVQTYLQDFFAKLISE